jgi:multicomponent Na+:H+ antiporter subunit B
MDSRELAGLLFTLGLAVLLAGVVLSAGFGEAPMPAGHAVLQQAPDALGTANIVTAVVLAYRGFDTLGELTILFTAALAAGLVLGHRHGPRSRTRAGFILRTAADLLFPFLILLGAYIVLHGHLTPGGGFQGGAIFAAAFFIPLLSRPAQPFRHGLAALVEGLAGVAFIGIGLIALHGGRAFLEPWLDPGTVGSLFSAGTLPLLYLAVGVKVGAELAGLLVLLGEVGAEA